MEREDAGRAEAEALEQNLWDMTAEDLAPLAVEMPSRLAALGLDIPGLLVELSDEGLALAIQKRFFVSEAFVELFVHRYTSYLARWFYHWQADAELAADLKQEVLLRFFQSRLSSYRATESFRAYLYTTAYHLWITRCRQAKRCDSLEVVPELVSNAVSPAEWAQRQELAARFRTILARLPEDERSVLELAVEGKTRDEIAVALGQSKPWVYARLFRARRTVEAELGLASRPRDRQGGRGEPVS